MGSKTWESGYIGSPPISWKSWLVKTVRPQFQALGLNSERGEGLGARVPQFSTRPWQGSSVKWAGNMSMLANHLQKMLKSSCKKYAVSTGACNPECKDREGWGRCSSHKMATWFLDGCDFESQILSTGWPVWHLKAWVCWDSSVPTCGCTAILQALLWKRVLKSLEKCVHHMPYQESWAKVSRTRR